MQTEPAARLKALVKALRDLHRNLVQIVRTEYENTHITSVDAATLLQLLTRDPHFDWLHELSQFMVVVDELLDGPNVSDPDAQAILLQARTLLAPQGGNSSAFYQRYVTYLQHHPELTMSHAEVRKIFG
jgi:hypothetical protein